MAFLVLIKDNIDTADRMQTTAGSLVSSMPDTETGCIVAEQPQSGCCDHRQNQFK
jgi:hypothetical protein